MQNKKLLVFFALLSILLASLILFSDETDGIPESSSYKLVWKGITTTGNESTAESGSTIDSIRSTSYILAASSGGQATSVMHDTTFSTDLVNYNVFPGFLKVWHDWRVPLIDFTDIVAADSALIRLPAFWVSWTGVDTTLEDGEGWGVWHYSVRYAISSYPGDTTDLVLETTDTTWRFDDPRVSSGDYVYFMITACDLARNCMTEWVYDTVQVITEMYSVTVENDFGSGHVSVDGVWYPSPYTISVIPGTEIEISDSVLYDYVDERHTFIEWDDGGVLTHNVIPESDTTFVALYQHEYRLQVSNDATWGGPVPAEGDHWYEDGERVCAWMTTSPVDDSIWCVGATGTGSVPVSVASDSFCFTMREPSSIVWHWDTFLVPCTLYVYSRYGTPDPMGTVLRECGTEICCNVELLDGPNRCVGWTGFGSVPATGTDTTVCFTLTETSHLVWQWNDSTMMPFTVINPDGYGSPAPPEGINWYMDGATVNASVTTPDGAYCQYAYYGSGDLEPFISDESSVTFTITRPSSILWLWEECSNLVTLTVTSDHGTPDPPVGTRTYVRGSNIDIYANPGTDTVYAISGETRYISTGWGSGLGSVPSVGDSSRLNFIISDNSEITWNWRTEHHIQLIYTGTGTAVPALSDSGWFPEDTLINIDAETPITDGSITYAFDRWEPGDSIMPLATAPAGSVRVWGPETYIAYYGPGIEVRLMKNPSEDTLGYFLIDGSWVIESNDTTIWFAEGSEHTFFASDPDSTDSVKYVYDRWSDDVANGGSRTITLGETYVAHYTKFWYTLFEKNPLADTYDAIYIDSDVYPGSSTGPLWKEDGTSATLQVLTFDYPPDSCHRYEFIDWSDGDTMEARSVTFDSPTVLYANYEYDYRVIVRKDPLERYGNIYIDDIVYPDSARVVFWADSGDSHHIGVSRIDEAGDTTFAFNSWNDFSTDTMFNFGSYVYFDAIRYGLCDSFVASYSILSNFISLRFEHPADGRTWIFDEEIGGVDSTTWDLDSIGVGETFNMSMPPTFSHGYLEIQNLSDLPVDLGLVVGEVVPAAWQPWYSQGHNRFVVRSRFTSIEDAPTTGPDFSLDRVKDELTWSTNGIGGIFGYAGENLDPGAGPLAGPDNTVYLWMHFAAPTSTDDILYETDAYIRVDMHVRTRLP